GLRSRQSLPVRTVCGPRPVRFQGARAARALRADAVPPCEQRTLLADTRAPHLLLVYPPAAERGGRRRPYGHGGRTARAPPRERMGERAARAGRPSWRPSFPA